MKWAHILLMALLITLSGCGDDDKNVARTLASSAIQGTWEVTGFQCDGFESTFFTDAMVTAQTLGYRNQIFFGDTQAVQDLYLGTCHAEVVYDLSNSTDSVVSFVKSAVQCTGDCGSVGLTDFCAIQGTESIINYPYTITESVNSELMINFPHESLGPNGYQDAPCGAEQKHSELEVVFKYKRL